MASYYLCPWATVFQYFTDTGVILSGGKVYTYIAGTSTPQTTYTDITGTVPNANPIILNANGRLPNISIWQPGGVALKVIVTDSVGNQIGPTFDQLQGIDDLVLATSSLSNPASGFGADLVANAMRSYDVFSSARAANVPILQSGQTLIVDFEGGVSVADGLGGLFYWNATSTAGDDGINVIKPSLLSGSGRYLRLNPYIEWFAVKGQTTSRVSTITVTNDPDLQVPIPTSGTYIVKGWFNDASGTSTGGLKGQIAFSGTIVAGYWGMNGNGTAVTTVPLTPIGTTATLQTAQTGVGNMPIDGVLYCTTSGTLTFSWAQNSSNATASVLAEGSYLRVTRVSSATGSFTPVLHTYATAGVFTETIPVGASNVTIEVWGASGGGNHGSGTGCGVALGPQGGSGGYVLTIVNVSANNGQTINFTVGTAGTGGGGAGGASTVSSGTFALTTMTGNGGGGGGSGGANGLGGVAGTASGGNTTNTTGNAGANGDNIGGGGTGAGIVGINGSGAIGGAGGLGASASGHVGGAGLVIFKYT